MSNPLSEIRNIRIGKATAMREQGLQPYPSRSRRTHYSKAVIDGFEAMNGQEVTVAGRLMSWRKQGGLAFGHIQDQSGRIQLFLRKQAVKPIDKEAGTIGFAEFNLIDLGDIVEATGKVMKTERGEISVAVETFRILTKTLRPKDSRACSTWSTCFSRRITSIGTTGAETSRSLRSQTTIYTRTGS